MQRYIALLNLKEKKICLLDIELTLNYLLTQEKKE